MGYERPYYEDINYHPFLFYVIFGADKEHLSISRERHGVDEFPDGLDFSFLEKPENEEYMNAMLGGALGELLERNYVSLYEMIRKTDQWAVIRGEVQNDSDLNYMRNTIGFVQALAENSGIGVLDLQTFRLYTAKEWTGSIFSAEFNPNAHIVILTSVMEDASVWLHTRGMRKFGRPDFSIKNVSEIDVDFAVKVMDQLIFYGARGAFFPRPVKLHTQDGNTCIVKPELVDDPENPDFNNSYYEILWEECQRDS